jgi:hypothetical protein
MPQDKTGNLAVDQRECKRCHLVKPITEFHKNKPSLLGRLRICNKCSNKRDHVTHRSRYFSSYPWAKHFKRAKERCKPWGGYSKRGCQFTITLEDVRFIWFRDKAFNMKKPSIDRKDSSRGYAFDNIRFIEFSKNIRRPKHYGRISP